MLFAAIAGEDLTLGQVLLLGRPSYEFGQLVLQEAPKALCTSASGVTWAFAPLRCLLQLARPELPSLSHCRRGGMACRCVVGRCCATLQPRQDNTKLKATRLV